jgi:hypothetical protein
MTPEQKIDFAILKYREAISRRDAFIALMSRSTVDPRSNFGMLRTQAMSRKIKSLDKFIKKRQMVIEKIINHETYE